MSTSTIQAEANRRNSALSTGPRTEEGKEAVSRNAVRHGFLAGVLPEERDDYRGLLESLREDLQPAGLMQELLVEEIAISYIRLRRIHAAEMHDMEPRPPHTITISTTSGPREETRQWKGCTPKNFLFDRQSPLLLRYEVNCQRRINHCLARLRELKADRRAAQSPELPNTRTPDRLNGNGFVSQNSESNTMYVSQITGNGHVSQENDSAAQHEPNGTERQNGASAGRLAQGALQPGTSVPGNEAGNRDDSDSSASAKPDAQRQASENGFVSQNNESPMNSRTPERPTPERLSEIGFVSQNNKVSEGTTTRPPDCPTA